MTQSIGLQAPEIRPVQEARQEPRQAPRRGVLRRMPKVSGERRAQFTRSDVRRGISPAQETASLESPEETSALVQEKLATMRVQASIVAAMLGMLVFFRGPLSAALTSVFS